MDVHFFIGEASKKKKIKKVTNEKETQPIEASLSEDSHPDTGTSASDSETQYPRSQAELKTGHSYHNSMLTFPGPIQEDKTKQKIDQE